MASRAISKAPAPDWRMAFRRSLRRACQMGGAILLIGAMIFLALALASYHQTDPSASTAAGDQVANWMGRTGAWAAERVLFLEAGSILLDTSAKDFLARLDPPAVAKFLGHSGI